MRHANKNRFLNALTLTFLISTATQAQEVKLLWSDTHDQVLARHNAALYTPVATPPNWVNEKYSISVAQQAMNKLYPTGRKVVKSVSVEGSDDRQQAAAETITIEGHRVPLTESW